jgi:hypothetical protein
MRLIVWIGLLFLLQNVTCLVNKNVERKIDISTHLIKVFSTITIDGPANEYIVTVESEYANHLAYIGAISKTGDEER